MAKAVSITTSYDTLLVLADTNAEAEAPWLREAECEALWQMGSWQEVSEPSAQQAEASDCFHAIICASLKVSEAHFTVWHSIICSRSYREAQYTAYWNKKEVEGIADFLESQ